MHIHDGLDAQRSQGGQKARQTVVISKEIACVLDNQQLHLLVSSGIDNAVHIVVFSSVAGNAFVGIGPRGQRADFRENDVPIGAAGPHPLNQGIDVVESPVVRGQNVQR